MVSQCHIKFKHLIYHDKVNTDFTGDFRDKVWTAFVISLIAICTIYLTIHRKWGSQPWPYRYTQSLMWWYTSGSLTFPTTHNSHEIGTNITKYPPLTTSLDTYLIIRFSFITSFLFILLESHYCHDMYLFCCLLWLLLHTEFVVAIT